MSMPSHILLEYGNGHALEHVQMDGPGMAYLFFFFNKQGYRGFKYYATQLLRTHVSEAFSEWKFPLCPFCHHSPSTGRGLALGSDRFRKTPSEVQGRVPRPPYAQPDLQQVRLHTAVGGECPNFHGGVDQTEETGGGCTPRVPISQLRGRPFKGCAVKNGARNLPSSYPDRGKANSEGYSMASEVLSTCHHSRR